MPIFRPFFRLVSSDTNSRPRLVTPPPCLFLFSGAPPVLPGPHGHGRHHPPRSPPPHGHGPGPCPHSTRMASKRFVALTAMIREVPDRTANMMCRSWQHTCKRPTRPCTRLSRRCVMPLRPPRVNLHSPRHSNSPLGENPPEAVHQPDPVRELHLPGRPRRLRKPNAECVCPPSQSGEAEAGDKDIS